MRLRLLLSPKSVLALLTLAGVGIALAFGGSAMFSPGPLNGDNPKGTRLGGVSSHAELSDKCSACHPPPWSSSTMGDRCLHCHTSVQQQIGGKRPLHGNFERAGACTSCHTEHKGEHAALTDWSAFDHDLSAFKLTGKHRTTACSSCHTGTTYKGTPHSCVACHAEPASHKGRFGTACAECHTTTTWAGATFKHNFPIDHHSKKKPSACDVCHKDANQFATYTCYGCHAHQPTKMRDKHVRKGIVEFEDCAKCHPTGRKKNARRAELDLELRDIADRLAREPQAELPVAITASNRRANK